MAVDASPYQNAQPFDPLGALQKATSIVSGIQANQTNARNLGAQRDIANILAQSTNADGSLDQKKAITLAKQSPFAEKVLPFMTQYQGNARKLAGSIALGASLRGATDPNSGYLDSSKLNASNAASGYGDENYTAGQNIGANANNPTRIFDPSINADRTVPQQDAGKFLTPNDEKEFVHNRIIDDPDTGKPMIAPATGAIHAQPGQTLTPHPVDDILQEHQQLNYLKDTASGIANNKNATLDDATDAITDAYAKGHLDAPTAVSLMGSLPKGADGGEAPSSDYQAWAKQHVDNIEQMKQKLNGAYGSEEDIKAATDPKSSTHYKAQQSGNMSNYLAAGLPIGAQDSMRLAVEDKQAANNVPNELNAVGNLENVIKEIKTSGLQPGTKLSELNTELAKIIPGYPQQGASDIQQMQKYIAQTLIGAGFPSSDEKLRQLQEGNIPKDAFLPTIEKLLPNIKAIAQSKQELADYLQSKGSDVFSGRNPDAYYAAKNEWNKNYSPAALAFINKKTDNSKGLSPEQEKIAESLTDAQRAKLSSQVRFIENYRKKNAQ